MGRDATLISRANPHEMTSIARTSKNNLKTWANAMMTVIYSMVATTMSALPASTRLRASVSFRKGLPTVAARCAFLVQLT